VARIFLNGHTEPTSRSLCIFEEVLGRKYRMVLAVARDTTGANDFHFFGEADRFGN
jgi:hypothetical protein